MASSETNNSWISKVLQDYCLLVFLFCSLFVRILAIATARATAEIERLVKKRRLLQASPHCMRTRLRYVQNPLVG